MKKTLILIFIFCSGAGLAQVGGRSSFSFLNAPPSARLSALGGVNVSLPNRDINLFVANPALISDSLARFASVNYQFMAGDVGHALFTYAHPFKKAGTISFAIQHLNYGDIQGYDASGLETAVFRSGETALIAGKAFRSNNFVFGMNVKGVFSSIAGLRSSALMVDLGGLFVHPEKPFTIGMAIRNAGVVLSRYNESSRNVTPLDIQLGTTFKPEHMPARFSFTAFNLNRPDATFDDPADPGDNPNTFQNVISHLNIGAELLLHRNVNVLVGYNFLARQTLRLPNGGGPAGLALGFSARIKTVDFVFSRTAFVAGAASYSFTLTSSVLKRYKH